jgi:hypothetical protein
LATGWPPANHRLQGGDLYHDSSWDTVWEADTRVDDEGWYAELRIPFSSIRYRPEPDHERPASPALLPELDLRRAHVSRPG